MLVGEWTIGITLCVLVNEHNLVICVLVNGHIMVLCVLGKENMFVLCFGEWKFGCNVFFFCLFIYSSILSHM